MVKQLLIKLIAGGSIVAVLAGGAATYATTASAMPATANTAAVQQATPPSPTASASTNTADPEFWPLDIQGRPTKLDAGSTRGWYFWHDDNGLHLDTTTPRPTDHTFQAVLTTKGTFRDIDKIHLERDDDIILLNNGHELVVQFHTYDGIDGVNFHIDGGDSVTLRLMENGHLIDRGNIFVGHDNEHPWSDPFTIDR